MTLLLREILRQLERLPDEVDDLLAVLLGGVIEILLVVHEEGDQAVYLGKKTRTF